MTKSIIAGACAAISLTVGAVAEFTGYSVVRSITAAGNTQYKLYANFSAGNYVFLNAFSWQNTGAALNARHQDAAEDLDGNPSQSWSASVNQLGATARDNDSWVTASGSGTSAGADASLDPGFNPSNTGEIPAGAGWFDATPGTGNAITAANPAGGFRMLIAQICRTGDDTGYFSTHGLQISYKVVGTSTALFGNGSFTIGDPACAGGPDCNANNCNDARDIATGTSADINANGVPDECEPDCNNNDRPDAYDISTGSSADINLNGAPDECEVDCNNNDIPDRYELAQGLVPDCNVDQIPDDCQGAARVALMSPDLGAPSGADARVAIFSNLMPAESPVTIVVRAIGDLSSASEYIEPTLNGVPAQRLFETGANDCPAQPDVGILSIQPGTFNELISDSGTLAIRLACPITVDGTECKGAGSLTVEVLYTGITDTGDCNGNERLDICEIADSTSPDCNANLKPDSCDIASGFSADCNTNGVPDSCDIASGAADCNANAVPDSCDVATGTSPDIDANNKPDECQTVTVNAGGSIQAVITAAPSNEMRIINVAPGTYAGPINLLGKPIRLIGTGGAAVTTISGTGGQSQSVIRAISGEPAISLIKGFTVKGGTTGSPLPQNPLVVAGGGILMAASSTSIEACILEQNNAAFGGGAYLYQHAGSVTGCTVRQNTAQAYGGGIQLYDSSTTVSGCTFTGNNAVTAGGGLHIVRSTPSLVGCTISGNGSFDRGGGISWDPDLDPSLLTIQQCQITGNDADLLGSGLFIYPTGVASETQLIGTTICGNAGRNVVGAYQADTASQVCDCRADLNGDGIVNGVDLATILSNWGTASATADLSGDGTVSGADLSTVLAAWGTCPST
jgi:parallel beta-helix repeat protein